MFDKDTVGAEAKTEATLSLGILSMAKVRGFLLTLDRGIDVLAALSKEWSSVTFPDDRKNFAEFIIHNCEKNEGLQKLYSIHTLQSLVARMDEIGEANNDWLERVARLLIRNLEYPLHSVSSTCEDILRKLLAMCSKEQIVAITSITRTLSSKHEIKAKYLALNLALSHLSAVQFVEENSEAIPEMIELSSETPVIGKYVLTFFEALLQKLWASCSASGKPDAWFEYWIACYLKALHSDDEALRTAACTYITPVVVRVNKMSLAYILSRFLDEQQVDERRQNASSLESLMTLLKVARQNKMIQICDDTNDLRLEQGVQLALFDLQPDGAKAFSILQSDLIKLVLTQNWKMSLECFQIVAQDTKNVG